MGILTDDMKRVVTEQRLGFMATVCPDGTANVSPKGTTAVYDDDHLVFADLRSPSTLGSDASFLQLRMEGERFFDLSELWRLRLRAERGASRVAEFSEQPVSQRFIAGGDRSVRGFDLNELSPTDAEGNRIGGENLATGTIEIMRALPRNFGVAAFYDAGNAFNSFTDVELEYSVGLGVRYNIAVASFGVDVAQALSESGRSPRFHLFISTQF